ncbi:MAG: glycosyltransferase, partial [Tenacibaculum sp.]
FLQKEFPDLEYLELPSYNISYAKNLKVGLLFQLPKIIKVVQKEHKVIADFIEVNNDVLGIISDNRFGVRNAKIPSVYITHQVNVLSGFFT